MLSKVDVSRVVIDHLETLKNNRTKKTSQSDLVVFFGLPLLVAVALIYSNILLNKDTINILITSFSVFAALLFNLLLLIYDIVSKNDEKKPRSNEKKTFLKEIYANISFSIVVAIITIIILLVPLLFLEVVWLVQIMSAVTFYATLLFLLTLLMILKRVHIMLKHEF